MRLAATTSLLALALLAQGCATPTPFEYGPIGEKKPFGYKDNVNADGGHTVLVVMPAGTGTGELRSVWDRRGDELCPNGVARRNVFRLDRKEAFTPAPYIQGAASSSSRSTLAMEVEGYVYCKVQTKAETMADGPKASTTP